MSKATDTQWRVQVRKSRNHKWANRGLLETRSLARIKAAQYRTYRIWTPGRGFDGPFGFGNTRVVKYQKK